MKINQSLLSSATLTTQVAVPVLMVLGIRVMTLDGGPAAASAASGASPVEAVPAAVIEAFTIDEAARREADDALRMAAVVIERDPFWSRAFDAQDTTIGQLAPLPPAPGEDKPRPVRVPDMRVTSIAVGRETVAVVNDRVCRVGDEAVPEWRVVSIDSVLSTVTIEHTTGLRETISLSR